MADNFNPWDLFGQNGNNKMPENWSNPDMSWVQGYINDIMKQAMPGQFNDGKNESRSSDSKKDYSSPDVFETHHYMIARIKVPEDIYPENVKVMFHTNELNIEGIQSRPLQIKLPRNGLYKGSKAHFKDHILEVRVPKRSKERYQEIPIQQ